MELVSLRCNRDFTSASSYGLGWYKYAIATQWYQFHTTDAWWFSLKLRKTDGWSEWSGTIVLSRLFFYAWRWPVDCKGGCQFGTHRLLASGYQSRLPTKCPRLTLYHRWRPRLWGEHTEIWNSGIGSSVSPVMSLASHYFTMMVMFVCTICKERDKYIRPTHWP